MGSMNPVVNDIGQVVAELREALGQPADGPPYYLYGHRAEMAKKLTATVAGKKAGKNKIYAYNRYPAILLRLDIGETEANGLIEYNLNIAILDHTDAQYRADERTSKVFEPILEPLYKKFLYALGESGIFMWEGDQEKPPHEKINRYFWGVAETEKNVRNYFTDPIDAIELVNLRVKKVKGCVTSPSVPPMFPPPSQEINYLQMIEELQQQVQALQEQVALLQPVDISALEQAIEDINEELDTIPSQIATASNNAVASVVGSAPELLNTIDEIANALGDNPDVINNILTTLGQKANTTDVTNALAGKATPGDITNAIDNLKGTAPGLLDTLGEISDALQDNPNVISDILTTLAGKANSADVNTALLGKANTMDVNSALALKADKTEIIPTPFTWTYQSGSNRYRSAQVTASGLTTVAVTSGALKAIPFVLDKVTTFNQILVDVTTLLAGGRVRVGIYTDTGNTYPGALIAGTDVAELTTDATGLKTNTINVTLQPGKYWLVYNTNTTATLRAININALPAVLQAATGATPYGSHWTHATAYGALPANYPASGASIATTAPIWIGLRY